ncbi:hypothetical protein GCM10010129_57440 [Streptomyces fumigatiscleroticus]|nr:hypothetical protein GCM10010129_57440 [Streptomyces fumigatiscleroticus]
MGAVAARAGVGSPPGLGVPVEEVTLHECPVAGTLGIAPGPALGTPHVRPAVSVLGVSQRTVWNRLSAARDEGRTEPRPRSRMTREIREALATWGGTARPATEDSSRKASSHRRPVREEAVQGKAEAFHRQGHEDERPVLSLDEVDAFIDALLADSDSDLAVLYSLDRPHLVSGVPDHELRVGMNGDLQLGVLSFVDEEGTVVSLGGSPGRGSVHYHLVGGGNDFPDRSEVPIALARQAVTEFLASGGQRPTCIRWQEPELR